MNKKPSPRKYRQTPKKTARLKELATSLLRGKARARVLVTGFPYRQFARLADKVPFTQKEWASLLHLSEKPLQRYARDESEFEGIYVDRLLQLKELIETGLETFSDSQELYRWLKRDKSVLGQVLNFDSLRTQDGISQTLAELNRILHGIYL